MAKTTGGPTKSTKNQTSSKSVFNCCVFGRASGLLRHREPARDRGRRGSRDLSTSDCSQATSTPPFAVALSSSSQLRLGLSNKYTVCYLPGIRAGTGPNPSMSLERWPSGPSPGRGSARNTINYLSNRPQQRGRSQEDVLAIGP